MFTTRTLLGIIIVRLEGEEENFKFYSRFNGSQCSEANTGVICSLFFVQSGHVSGVLTSCRNDFLLEPDNKELQFLDYASF